MLRDAMKLSDELKNQVSEALKPLHLEKVIQIMSEGTRLL
jgi:hypothetical protein